MRYALLLLCLPLVAQEPSGTARIEGRVIDSEKKPVANAIVMTGLLTDRQPHSLGRPLRGIRVVNSSKGGAFVLRGLAPGNYRVAAFDTAEAGALWNHAFLEKFAGEASRIEVKEGAKVDAPTPLVPADRFNEEFKQLP